MESSIASLGKCLFDPVKNGFLHLYHYKENIKKLKIQIEDLIVKCDTIESLVQEGRNMRSEKPTIEVENWLVKVNRALQDSSKIEEEVGKEREKRLCGWFPNWYTRYHLSKEAAKIVDLVKEIIGQGNFTRITVVAPTPSVEPILDNSIAFASVELVFDQIMQALQDNDTNILGIHGMGGVGKTTLMKRLNNKLGEIKLFDKVIMVSVSKNPVIRIIQDGIAERLCFVCTDVNPDIRACKLSKRLKEEKTVLIILDDLWSRFELNEVGIPCKSEHEGCKIILTTRNKDICRQMGTQWESELKVLPELESWALLKSKAGDVVDSDKIKPIAKQIIKSCKGLPLAIVTIASTLKMKEDEHMWNDALRALDGASAIELEEVIPQVITSIRISYDSLQCEGIKLFFLLCCLFPEDWKIDTSILIAYGIAEGCFRGCRNYLDARDKCYVFIEKLKAASLLIEGYNSKCVGVHDIVRDVGIHIASNENDIFVKSGLKLVEWPEMEELGRCSRISLMNNEITTLPNNPECPQLLTLILQGSPYLEKMSDLFFEKMRGLVILDLGGTEIQLLPSSISYLKCLRALLLHFCAKLKDISAIEGLEKLEILILAWTAIQELPKGIKGSANLKHLDLRETKSLNVSSNLISSLSHLEELYMSGSFSRWETGDQGDRSKAHFSEVASLPRLAILHVDVQNPNWWYEDHFASLKNLTSFDICKGSVCDFSNHLDASIWLFTPHHSRIIEFNGVNILCISDWVKVLLQKTEQLSISNVEGLKNILQLGGRGLNNLRRLFICNDYEMEYLINVEEEPPCIAFPRLTCVSLSNLRSLISIWKGVVPVGSLDSLDSLAINNCHNIKYLLSIALMQTLQNLTSLQIHCCNRMKKIILDEEETVVAGGSVLPQELPKPWALCNLQHIFIGSCNNLKYVFPYRLVQNLVHLDRIEVHGCSKMEEIISIGKEEALGHETVLPMLRAIDLCFLPKLRTISDGRPIFYWPSLEEMCVKECPQLKRLPMGSQSAARLRKLRVEKEWLEGLEWEDQTIKSRISSLAFGVEEL